MKPCLRGQIEVPQTPTPLPSRVAYDQFCNRDAHGDLRQELWSAFVAALNHSKLPYCLLGASEDATPPAGSDVDFAVSPDDYPNVPQLLASAAASAGGQLVQAIEHETTATYFAMAIQQREIVAFLHPDCTADYRRQKRLWISSEQLLGESRRVPGGYSRPAPPVDFKYYLTKQVLKQTVSVRQWKKLAALYQAAGDPQEALSWWRPASAAQIEQTLRHNDREAFKNLVSRLRSHLINIPLQESAIARASAMAFDAARVLARIAHPTGLFVQISNGSRTQRTELAWKLAKTLAPAFRRSCVVASRNPARVLRALIESTLVISVDELITFRTLYGGVDLHWQPALAPRDNFECAVAALISHMAQRTMRRLELQSLPSQPFELDAAAAPTAS